MTKKSKQPIKAAIQYPDYEPKLSEEEQEALEYYIQDDDGEPPDINPVEVEFRRDLDLARTLLSGTFNPYTMRFETIPEENDRDARKALIRVLRRLQDDLWHGRVSVHCSSLLDLLIGVFDPDRTPAMSLFARLPNGHVVHPPIEYRIPTPRIVRFKKRAGNRKIGRTLRDHLAVLTIHAHIIRSEKKGAPIYVNDALDAVRGKFDGLDKSALEKLWDRYKKDRPGYAANAEAILAGHMDWLPEVQMLQA